MFHLDRIRFMVQPAGFVLKENRFARLMLAAAMLSSLIVGGGGGVTGPREWVRNGFKVGPDYCPPVAPVAQAWIEANDANIQNRHLQDWWGVFQDPALDSLVATAYARNPNIRVLGARVLEARAQQAIAVGSIFPQAQQMTGQYSRVGISHNTVNNPSFIADLSPFPIPPGTPIANYYSDWSAGFNLSWELDFWGRFRRNIESANARVDASVENYDDSLVTLFADVATNYVQYRIAQQRIKIAFDNVRIQEGVLSLSQERFKVGSATELDVKQAKTVLEGTRAMIPVLQISLGQASDQLCILLGIPPRDLSADLGPGPQLGANPMPNTPAWAAAGIPADLLRRRPDVRSAERQVAAQSAQIGVAEADFYPAIFVNGTLGYESADLSHLFESRSFMGTVAPAFRWNILNYGRIENNVRLQQARTQELIAAYQSQVLKAAREAQSALRGFLRSQEQSASMARSVEAALGATEIGVKQYNAGTVSFNTVFQLETAQVQQQDQLVLAQGNIALNLIGVYRALGGGWEFRLQQGGGISVSPPTLPPSQAPPPEAVPEPPSLPAPSGS
jgi:NodT family efflux transporter outer membrane factor (OMF) lipoprotein